MAWYYHLNGENQGPVEASELQSLKARDVISLETPVWTEGMTTWAAYGTSPAYSGAPALAGVLTPSASTQVCVQCFQTFPESEMLKYEQSWVCPACKPLFFQRIREGVQPLGQLVFASVGARFVAILIDGLIYLGVAFVIAFTMMFVLGGKPSEKPEEMAPREVMALVFTLLIIYTIPVIYEIVFIGKYGATLGKMAMKIKVVRPDGSPVSWGQAAGRFFAKILSHLIFYIGYLMAFWDPERRALHDQICNTRVMVNRA